MAPDFTDGFKPVPDSGTPIPAPCGTEEPNEGKASGGNKWAKRKYRTAPADYSKKYPEGNE